MNRLSLFLLPLLFGLVACTRNGGSSKESQPLSAQSIIDQTIKAHGGAAYGKLHYQFRFRDREYEARRQKGRFQLERRFEEEGKAVRDLLSNAGFVREIDGQAVTLADSFQTKYGNSVNSVHYFAQLPYGLNDPAVNKSYLGTSNINEIDYHKVQITFQEEGGGTDFDDVFVYWIHPESFTMDFLAYAFHTDGGGLRFREAYHAREVGGIRYQDYVNYKADPAVWKVQELDRAFNEGKLEKLSLIELEELKAL